MKPLSDVDMFERAQEIRDVLVHIDFEDWNFVVGLAHDQQLYLQVEFHDKDNYTHEEIVQRGRKWVLSPHMTKSEIVQTALKAVLSSVEHEAREKFRYRGRAIFGPHFDVDALVEFSRSADNIDMRTGEWVA